ncbi:MAG: alpha/beta fold hydrolase [bacterium]|nr:alpha/beta fold hydrolase [bacterium]
MTKQRDISILGNVTQHDEANFSEREKEIARLGRELDARFLPQFERREFTFMQHAQVMKTYLPEGLHDDKNLVSDQHVRISYNYFPARKDPDNAETIFVLGGIYNAARRADFFAEGAAGNYNVVALDYPGKGHSGNLKLPGDYTLDTYAAIVRATIDAVAPAGKYHLLGNSHGTKVVYAMVEQGFSDPNWSSTIIGDMPPETPAGPKLRRAWRNRERPFSETMEEAVRKLTSFLAGHGAPVAQEFVVHDFNHGFENFTREGFGWAYDPNSMHGYADEYMKPYDKWDAFKKIPTPILMLAGETSNTATPDAVQKMLEARPDMSLMLYQGVGHYPELVTAKRIEEVLKWVQHVGEIKSPLRAIVPADPEKDMVLHYVQDNKAPAVTAANQAAKTAPKQRKQGGPA